MRHPAAAHRYDVLYEPFSLGTVLSVVGTAASVIGSFQEGRAQQADASAAQQQANFQMQQRRQEAQRAREISKLEAGKFEREQSALRARARAVRSASGVSPTGGSSLLVDEDIAREIARNKALIEAGGAVQGTRLEQEADLLGLSGRNAARAGSAARTGSFFKAGSTALTGLSKIDFS